MISAFLLSLKLLAMVAIVTLLCWVLGRDAGDKP